MLSIRPDEIASVIQEQIEKYSTALEAKTTGTVLEVSVTASLASMACRRQWPASC